MKGLFDEKSVSGVRLTPGFPVPVSSPVGGFLYEESDKIFFDNPRIRLKLKMLKELYIGVKQICYL